MVCLRWVVRNSVFFVVAMWLYGTLCFLRCGCTEPHGLFAMGCTKLCVFRCCDVAVRNPMFFTMRLYGTPWFACRGAVTYGLFEVALLQRKNKSKSRNCDYPHSPRQIAIISVLRDKSRISQITATNRAFSFKSKCQISRFSNLFNHHANKHQNLSSLKLIILDPWT